jgi:multiple sugar transport system substrate-binding protein
MSEKKFSRRHFLRMAGVSAAGAILASRLTGTPTRVRAQDVTGTLSFWGHANHPLDNIRDAFLKVYPNVKFDYVYSDDYTAKFQTAMAAGTGAPDLFWAEADAVQLYGSQGALLNTTDIIEKHKDKLLPSKVAEAFVPNQNGYFGMPGDLSASGIYYRADIMKELGIEIPTDMMYMPDFLDILKKIAAAGKKAVLYPKGGTFVASAQWGWFTAQYGGSGPASCDNQSVTINSEASQKAVALIKAIYDTGATLATDFWSPEYWNAINTDQLVLDLCPAWARGFWEANVDSSKHGLWALAPMPRAVPGGPRSAVWGGATLISPKTSEAKADLVKLFMEFAFASMDGARAAGDWGIIPPYIPYLETEFQKKETKLFGKQNIGAVILELGKEISTAYCRTAVYSAAINEYITPKLDSMVTGGADIKATLDAINAEVTNVLPDYQP